MGIAVYEILETPPCFPSLTRELEVFEANKSGNLGVHPSDSVV